MMELSIKDFKLLSIIGTGSTSRVFKVKHNNKLYAIKAEQKDRVLLDTAGVREKNIWRTINHPFLINMLACFKTAYHLCYVMEYTPGGDIENIVADFYHGKIPEKHAKFYTAEIVVGVDYLHSIGIVHRDIKPKNILIAADGHVKIADFDIAVDIRHEAKPITHCGTVGFMAPEIPERKPYGYEVDWWSVGATLYFMMYGCTPVKKTEADKGKELSQFECKFTERISNAGISILKGFMEENPDNRLGKEGLQQIKSQKFFMDIDWEKIEEKRIKPPFVPSLHSLPNIRERVLPENYSLSADYCISKKHENLSDRCNREKHFNDFYYINPNWEN